LEEGSRWGRDESKAARRWTAVGETDATLSRRHKWAEWWELRAARLENGPERKRREINEQNLLYSRAWE